MTTETIVESSTTVEAEHKSEEDLQKAFENLIEIRHQKAILEQMEESLKKDAMDYLTEVAHMSSGRFIANGVTADVHLSFRPQREYDSETQAKMKELDEQLSVLKKSSPILHFTPYLVVHIVDAEPH
ncbi:MAG: hypothetical protein M1470_00450 [Bacteroidetes bacterium]|nr:hypothetical protein [Bacteroidota bacterium]MCL5737220.1 hypothetical protein [Bacteroidota bacterium]